LLNIEFIARSDHLGLVIGTLDQLAAIIVTEPKPLRRIESFVVNATRPRVHPTARQAPYDLSLGNTQFDGNRLSQTRLTSHQINEVQGLSRRSRVTIQNQSFGSTRIQNF
jgi:hypothetical protein